MSDNTKHGTDSSIQVNGIVLSTFTHNLVLGLVGILVKKGIVDNAEWEQCCEDARKEAERIKETLRLASMNPEEVQEELLRKLKGPLQ
jgi:hypothetical protein